MSESDHSLNMSVASSYFDYYNTTDDEVDDLSDVEYHHNHVQGIQPYMYEPSEPANNVDTDADDDGPSIDPTDSRLDDNFCWACWVAHIALV